MCTCSSVSSPAEDTAHTPTPHPHAALMAEYAKDAAVDMDAYKNWEFQSHRSRDWVNCLDIPNWLHNYSYRRKPTPHVHAELMAQYKEEVAEDPLAYKNWEYKSPTKSWATCPDHPCWYKEHSYRRKPAPKEFWINEYDGYVGGLYTSKEEAVRTRRQVGYKRTIHLREVI